MAGVLEKLEEEKREVESALSTRDIGPLGARRLEEEIGDLLFAGVNVARFLGVDPEIALKKANGKFKERFQWMEAAERAEGRRFADASRERMEELWNESKRAEKLRAEKTE